MNKKFMFYNDSEAEGGGFRRSMVFTAAMIAVIIAVIVFSLVVAALSDTGFSGSDLYIYLNYFVVSFALFIGALIVYKRLELSFRDVSLFSGDKKSALYYAAIILLVFIGTYFGVSGVNEYFVEFLSIFGYTPSVTLLPDFTWYGVILCILFIAVIPAVIEEIVFRGIMLGGSSAFGKIQAVFVTAAAFSLYHMSPAQTIYQFIIGVIYGLIATSCGSVVPTMILHFLNNAVIILVYYFCPQLSFEPWLKITVTVFALLFLAAGIYLTVRKCDFRSEKVKHDKKEVAEYLFCILPGFFICLVVWIVSLFA